LFPWLSPPDERSNILEELFEGILEVDPRKEAILRSIISTTKTRDGEDRKRSIIALIRDAVTELCTPILALSQPSRSAEFKRDLEEFLRAAVDIWNFTQRIQPRVMATSEINDKAIEWKSREEHDQMGQAQEPVSEEPIKALYPSVYQGSLNEPSPLHSGCAVWSDQELYIAGSREFQAQSRRISSQQRRASNGFGARRSYPSTRHKTPSNN